MKANKIDQWKFAVINMRDSSFFELLRMVFGKIKTPYNKHQLLKDLEKFLLREDIQKTIAAYINTDDEKVIAAVAFFGEPAPEELERFFESEFSYAKLHEIINNLEERFILYRYNSRLALNPVLDKLLAPIAANTAMLFTPAHPAPKEKPEKTMSALNDRVLAGLLSFVLRREETSFYKKGGQIRKQIIDEGKNCFSGLNLEEIFGSLCVLGLFRVSGENLVPDKEKFADIALLSVRERMEYCAASFVVYKDAVFPSIDIQAPYYKNRIKEAVTFIHSLIDSLAAIQPLADHYSKETVIKLAEVHKSRMENTIDTNTLMKALEKTGLLSVPKDTKQTSSHAITIDSGYSIFVYPEINFTDAIELASFLNIKEAGAAVCFELEKASAVRAFDCGVTAQKIIDILTRLSGKKVPDTLAWNLKDWEKRHNEVSLRKGVVLTLAKDKQYLAKTMPLSALITDTLALGVYLLNEDSLEKAVVALHNAGVDIIKRSNNADTQNKTNLSPYFAAPVSSPGIFSKMQIKHNAFLKNDLKANELKQNFRAILEKMPLSKAERSELSARIDRRLILCEAQLKEATIRYEKLEARSMDYAGKQIIARQAASQNSFVEIVYHNGKDTKQVCGKLCKLEKIKYKLILIITPANSNKTLRIPLEKISLLRRIKKSIFET